MIFLACISLFCVICHSAVYATKRFSHLRKSAHALPFWEQYLIEKVHQSVSAIWNKLTSLTTNTWFMYWFAPQYMGALISFPVSPSRGDVMHLGPAQSDPLHKQGTGDWPGWAHGITSKLFERTGGRPGSTQGRKRTHPYCVYGALYKNKFLHVTMFQFQRAAY
jgi:hypothetical protein